MPSDYLSGLRELADAADGEGSPEIANYIRERIADMRDGYRRRLRQHRFRITAIVFLWVVTMIAIFIHRS